MAQREPVRKEEAPRQEQPPQSAQPQMGPAREVSAALQAVPHRQEVRDSTAEAQRRAETAFLTAMQTFMENPQVKGAVRDTQLGDLYMRARTSRMTRV